MDRPPVARGATLWRPSLPDYRRWSRWMIPAVGFFVLCSVAPSHAKREKRKHRKLHPRWRAELVIDQTFTDNVQEQHGPNQADDFFTTMKTRLVHEQWWGRNLSLKTELGVNGRVYHEFSAFDYAELRPRATLRIARRTDLSLLYGYTPDRVLFDPDDGSGPVFYREHLLWFSGRHRFGREKRLRLSGVMEVEWRDYRAPESRRDSFSPGVRGRVRYVLSPLLMPFVGVRFVSRDAERDNYDRNRFDVGAGVDSQWRYGIRFRFRYRHSWRDYRVAGPRDPKGRRNSNFRRNDEVDKYQFRMSAPLPWWPGLSAGIGYAYKNGTSTRVDRIYNVNEFSLQLSYAFSGRSPW